MSDYRTVLTRQVKEDIVDIAGLKLQGDSFKDSFKRGYQCTFC